MTVPFGIQVQLPELLVHAPSETEARVVYHEIFDTEAYGKHGISVHDGDCVFDVGANIGLYSMFLLRRHQRLGIYAFEPLAPIYELLTKNMALHDGTKQVRLFNLGLASKEGRAKFRFDAELTFNSSSHANDLEACTDRGAGTAVWARALVEDGERTGQIPSNLASFLLKALSVPVLRWATIFLFWLVFAASSLKKRLTVKELECELRTLSAVLRDEKVERIDLLKVDVEGAEEDVLGGIDEADWPKIRQMVIEVHDVGGRVARMRDKLALLGYEVVVDREDWAVHRLLGIHTIYAKRA